MGKTIEEAMGDSIRDNSNADYDSIKRAIDILKILKTQTDTENDLDCSMSLSELCRQLHVKETGGNDKTIAAALDRVLLAVNPVFYEEDHQEDYRITYENYEDNLVLQRKAVRDYKQKMTAYKRKVRKENPKIGAAELEQEMTAYEQELKADMPEEVLKNGELPEKIPSVTKLRYVHDFSFEELDDIINALYFSKTLSAEERERLIYKLTNLSSERYQKKWFSNNSGKPVIKNVFQGIEENNDSSRTELKKNISKVQSAIEEGVKISYVFNGYNAERKLAPSRDKNGHPRHYVATPYHILAYNGKYYMVGNLGWYNNLSIWRLDLMSDVQLLEEKARPKKEVEGMSEPWSARQYMEEHLNMFYDAPVTVRLKIPNDRYTMMVDWFGDNFQKRRPFDAQHDVVTVKCSKNAMVNWAMQYSDVVEVLGPQDVKDAIVQRCHNLLKKMDEMV